MAKYALFRFHRICVGAGKAGIITYTRSAGHELEFAQHGVKFICLCPGAVQTSIQVCNYIEHFLHLLHTLESVLYRHIGIGYDRF